MKMYPTITILLFLSLFSFQVFAQDYAVSKIPESIKENTHTVIRHSETIFDIHSPESATETRRYVATIFNEKSHYNLLVVPYDQFRSVKSIHGVLYDQNGREQGKLKKSSIEDFSTVSGFSLYEDSRAKATEISHNRYPYTVEFIYIIDHNGIQDYPDWFPQGGFEVGVEKSSFEIRLPEAMVLHFKARNTDIKPVTGTEKGTKSYRWEIKNLAAVEAEPYSPSSKVYLPSIDFAPNEFEVAGFKGSMADWQSFGQFIYELNDGRGELSQAMKQKVKDLTGNASSKADKIKVLYDYLQENTRYVSVQLGIGGWQTFPAEYVEKNKYGDCKALTYFMRSMLEEAGVESYPALIRNSRYIPEIDEFADPSFNHVILYVPSTDEPTWLECTSTHNPPNYIGYSNENRKALVIKSNESQLISTPSSKAKNNMHQLDVVVYLEETGAAKVSIYEKSTGYFQDNLRYIYHNLSGTKKEEWLIESLPLSGFTLKNYTLESHEDKPQVDLEMELEIDKSAAVSGSRIFFRPNMLDEISVPEKLEKRQHPIQKKSATTNRSKTTFIIPEGYALESKPKERLEIDNEFGHYISGITVKENQITYTRYLLLKSFDLPAERYDDLREFYLSVSKADRVKLALVKE